MSHQGSKVKGPKSFYLKMALASFHFFQSALIWTGVIFMKKGS